MAWIKGFEKGTPSINASPTINGTVTINGGSVANVAPLELVSTDPSNTFGPSLSLYRNSASPNGGDTLGAIEFYGKDSAGNKQRYGLIASGIITTTSGAEESRLYLQNVVAGVPENIVQIDGRVVELNYGQIQFPAAQNPSTNANTLDDYEEGTWTPVVFGVTTAGVGTYTQQEGFYVKVGKFVWISMQLVQTAHTGTGAMRVSGVPFGNAEINHTLSLWTNANYVANASLGALSSTTNILLYNITPGSTAEITMDPTCTIRVSGWYMSSN